MRSRIWWLISGLSMLVTSGLAVGGDVLELQGRIIGEQCAQRGKIGECYLQWAEPMVFWTEEGDYYAIDQAGGIVVDQVQLDKAFGQEVKVQGTIIADERIQLTQLTILNPVGDKEFFKG